jgi:flagellar hook protein FlgE
VAEGSFAEDSTVYFANGDGKYVSTYEADAVKLVIKNQKGENLSIAELDVLGVTGDNVDFRTATDGSDTTLIGKLKTDYQYGTEETDVIPAGSIVFTGKYKGNAAYNVVMLFDQDGNIVGGVNEDGDLQAQQVILSDVPDTGDIADTNDGIWIYWIEPEQNVDLSSVKQVRAELYRVNDATTNEGQRLVSDSLFETMPETLPDMELNGGTN